MELRVRNFLSLSSSRLPYLQYRRADFAQLDNSRDESNLAKTENTMLSLGAHMARTTHIDLDKAQNEKEVAQGKHEEALTKQYGREAQLNSFTARM